MTEASEPLGSPLHIITIGAALFADALANQGVPVLNTVENQGK